MCTIVKLDGAGERKDEEWKYIEEQYQHVNTSYYMKMEILYIRNWWWLFQLAINGFDLIWFDSMEKKHLSVQKRTSVPNSPKVQYRKIEEKIDREMQKSIFSKIKKKSICKKTFWTF